MKPVAGIVPNITIVAPVNPLPIIITLVSPASGPLVGTMPDMVGPDEYVNWSAAEMSLVPPGAVTLMSTVPADPAGEVAVILAPEFTVKPVAGIEPNITIVAPVNRLPVIITLVPPARGPLVGEMPVMVGTAMYVNWSAAEMPLVPPGVVTVTSTVPADPAGEAAVI